MTTPQPIPQALRALHAAKVHHFTPFGHGGQPQAPAFAIVATEERLGVLLDAASELEAQQRAEDRKAVQRLQGWIDQQEAAANGGHSEARVWQERYMALLTEVASVRALLPPEPVVIDGAGLHLLTHEQVRQMVMTVKFEQRDELEINRVLNDLCRRLGVEL